MPRATAAQVIAERPVGAPGQSGIVRPGFRSKLLGWSLASAPRALRTQIMPTIMGAMTRQRSTP